MSEYIHFFIRLKENFLPIFSFSRNFSIYQFYKDYASYGKICVLSMQKFQDIRENINAEIDEWSRRIEERRDNLQLIASFNNSVEDKIEALESARDVIREDEEYLEEIKEALYFTQFLMNIYDEAENTKYYEDEKLKIDPTKYIYFGIECANPSIAEIEE